MAEMTITPKGDAPSAMQEADHWADVARKQGVFVQRWGATVVINGPIKIGIPAARTGEKHA